PPAPLVGAPGAGGPDFLPDPPPAQSRERFPAERLRQELDRAEFDARVRGDGARLEHRVARSEPAQVAADSDLAGIVGRAPPEAYPRLQIGATAALSRVGLSVEEPLG